VVLVVVVDDEKGGARRRSWRLGGGSWKRGDRPVQGLLLLRLVSSPRTSTRGLRQSGAYEGRREAGEALMNFPQLHVVFVWVKAAETFVHG